MAPPGHSATGWRSSSARGELVRVDAEVDPHLEITEINDRVVKSGGPALLFTNPKGSSHPLLINQFGTERRMCLAFDATSLDSVAGRLEEVLEMQPPQGLAEKVRRPDSIVIVDKHVNVHDYEEVFFYVGASVDAKRDIEFTEGPLDHLDHAPTLQFYGGKIGIDATAKGPLEGTREWPPEIEMSPDVKALVDSRWSEYGLDAAAAQQEGRRSALQRLLRR